MLSPDQVATYRFKYNLSNESELLPKNPSALDTIKDAAAGGIDKMKQGAHQVVTPPSATGVDESAFNVPRGALKVGAGAVETAFSPLAPLFKPIADGFSKLTDFISNSKAVQDFAVSPAGEATSRVAEDVSNFSTIAGAIAGLKVGPAATSRLNATGGAALSSILRKVTGKEPLIGEVGVGSSAEDIARLADAKATVQSTADAVMKREATPASLKTATESASVPVTFTEKLAGLAPDVKARIKGKGNLLADYLNVTDARNSSDLVPTPLEYGASFADDAVEKMQNLLSDTGGKIGQFRTKISTYQAPREAFGGVRQSFLGELDKLNLEVYDGAIRVKSGKIAQTVSDAEITSLQKLYDDLNTASQNPSLENLIDLRTKFDNKINFDKAAREASNSLDPLSRSVRKKVADVASQIVGKSESKNLEEYSKFMDALNDLRSYTDRKAGAEFLLKRVFSERGGDPRAIMQTIYQHTGIDLMDHAMMARIATELGGNSATQGLFRQEVARAGLDVANLLKGNPTGAIDTLLQKGMDTLIDKRKAFQKAAQ
jgi:hypothetical protein